MEENYKATGLERVEIAEETTYKTGAQHLLIINDSTITKYRRQDCLDENPELLLFYPGKWRLIKQMFPYLAFKNLRHAYCPTYRFALATHRGQDRPGY
ncbi:MAG: hypothetical protein LH618_06690 [Saprospiraceae bacterium]|nr:hypothetical protein [Saprospiraceae bacterium]